jgi:hypothetical protein
MDQGQRPVTNRAMCLTSFVLGMPFFALFAGIVHIQKPMLTEALHPNRRVEAFHVGIVGWLARAADTR